MTPLAKLVYDALTFADIAAGEGICFSKTHNRPEIDPADFLMAYSLATDDEDWDTFALRLAERIEDMEVLALSVHNQGIYSVFRDEEYSKKLDEEYDATR